MYYAILSAAVTMVGFQFLFNQQYQKIQGNSPKAAFRFAFGANTAGFLILSVINKFRFEFTPFTFLVAFVVAVDMMIYNVCSIKALGKVNISMFSVFAMLGGMFLPFIAGIAFFNESVTVGKLICVVLIAIALLLTVGSGDKKSGLGYCFGVFFTNGFIGVASKFFSSAQYEKTSEAGYSIILALILAVSGGVASVFVKGPKLKASIKTAGMSVGYGLLNNIGNFLVLMCLSHIPVTVQYPFITGGVIIISTIICCFTDNKPTKKEIISVIVSFAGILALSIK